MVAVKMRLAIAGGEKCAWTWIAGRVHMTRSERQPIFATLFLLIAVILSILWNARPVTQSGPLPQLPVLEDNEHEQPPAIPPGGQLVY